MKRVAFDGRCSSSRSTSYNKPFISEAVLPYRVPTTRRHILAEVTTLLVVLCAIGAIISDRNLIRSDDIDLAASTKTSQAVHLQSSGTVAPPKSGPAPPHIVFILADDLGQNDLGFTWVPGSAAGQIETPRIDSLALRRGSVVLAQCYAAPMCTPTRAALLTGVHPTRTGLHHFVLLTSQPAGLPVDLPTLPEELRTRFGYKTHLVGKWHLGFAKRAWLPTHRGFDSFWGFAAGAQDYWTHDTAEWLEGPRQLNRAPVSGHAGHDWWRGDASLRDFGAVDGQHGMTLAAREAGAVIAQHGALVRAHTAAAEAAATSGATSGTSISTPSSSSSRPPLFLYVASQAPHAHFVGAPGDAYRRVDSMRDAAHFSPARREVAALVSSLDSLVGDIEDSLRAAELWQDALLVFAGDNGPEGSRPLLGPAGVSGASAHPLRGRKRTVWEGGVRVTAFLHAPNPLRVAPAADDEPTGTQYSSTGTGVSGSGDSSSSDSSSGGASASNNGSSPLDFDERLGVRGGHALGNARAFEGLFHFVDWAPTLLAAAADRLGEEPIEVDVNGDGSATASNTGSNHTSSSWSSGRVQDQVLGGGPLGAVGRFPGLPYDGGARADPSGRIANGISAWEALAGSRSSHQPPHRIEALLQYDPVARCGALRRRNLKLVWNGDCGNPLAGFGGWDPTNNDASRASSTTSNGGKAKHDEGDDVWQLFDLKMDPEERNDLLSSRPSSAASPEHLEAAQAMRRSLEAHGGMTQPALSWLTPGDLRASPHLHDGRWVNWLDEPVL